VIITKLSWSGEAGKLGVEPEGRSESPEAKQPQKVGHAWYKADIAAYT